MATPLLGLAASNHAFVFREGVLGNDGANQSQQPGLKAGVGLMPPKDARDEDARVQADKFHRLALRNARSTTMAAWLAERRLAGVCASNFFTSAGVDGLSARTIAGLPGKLRRPRHCLNRRASKCGLSSESHSGIVVTMGIRSFRHEGAEDINYGRSTKAARRILPAHMHERARVKLARLHAAESLSDLATLPGNRFEQLRGDRAGQYGIRINDQYRICFTWENNDAVNVEIVDYH